MKKNFIIGTSGHVDHGKTALIKALTGKDLDTHKEEKKRGITINNGFTHLTLDEFEVGVIDVPGHRDFIKNMIAGATGIDVAMLVIAANSGPEKQTLEHLKILDMLNVSSVIIVLTKCDLVDEEELELTNELISELCEETKLEGAPIIQVSALKQTGLDDLKTEIISQLKAIQSNTAAGPFRHYLDRSFIIQGHGTVVTGTVHSGSCQKGQKLWLHPAMKEVNIRSIQRHGKSADEVFSGDRCSLNVTGIKKEEISPGMLISDRQLNQVSLIDAELEVFGDIKPGDFWCDALFFTGSFDAQVKLSLLDKEMEITEDDPEYLEGETFKKKRFIQIHLPSPFPVSYGDKFILRNTSDTHTIGGGKILDPNPLHHKRRSKTVLERLQRISDKGLNTLLNIKIHEAAFMKSVSDLAAELNLSHAQIEAAIEKGLSRISILKGSEDTYLIPQPRLKALKKEIIKVINDYHIINYLSEAGISLDEIAPKFKSYTETHSDSDFIKQVLTNLCKEDLLVFHKGTWSAKGRDIFADSDLKTQVEKVKDWYTDQGMCTYSQRILFDEMAKSNIEEETVNKMVIFLQKSDWLTRMEDVFLVTENINSARDQLLSHLLENDGITVAGFRDLLEGNRKFCLNCFALYEKEGLVIREGDDRILTEKGRQAALQLAKQEA